MHVQLSREGTTLHGELTGPEQAPLLAFIHGGFMDRHMFDGKLRRRMAAVWRMSALVTGLLPTSAIRSQLPRGTAVTAPAKQYVRTATATITKADFLWLTQASRQAGQGLQSRRIDQPQLIIRGASDTSGSGRLTALTASHWIARDQNARYEVIPGAGHQAHQDQPEVFDRLLLDFLNG